MIEAYQGNRGEQAGALVKRGYSLFWTSCERLKGPPHCLGHWWTRMVSFAERSACSDEQTAKERVILFARDHDGELWQLVAPFDSLRELKS